MKCSLLTLSTFIDGALPPERTAEVDAHLVGCPRCSAGAATLREERGRIAQLARVSVDRGSAQALLEQVGIIGSALLERPDRPTPVASAPTPNRPWVASGGSAALPWTPQRPQPSPALVVDQTARPEEQHVPTVSPDVQPDLPFESASRAPAAVASPGVEAHPGRPLRASEVSPPRPGQDDQVASPLEPWEAATPGYAEARAVDVPWKPALEERHPTRAEGQVTLPAPEVAPSSSPTVSPPQRVVAPQGPRAVWEKARDLVAVRLALARGEAGVADGVEIVTDAPSSAARQLPPPMRGFEAPEGAAVDVPPLPQPVEEGAMELTGVPGAGALHPRAAAAQAAAPRELETAADPRGESAPAPLGEGEPAPRWNAFGAAAFRGGADPAAEAVPVREPVRPIGRHSRAVRQQSAGASIRVRQAMAAVTGLLGRGGARALTVVQRGGTRAGAGMRSRAASGALPTVNPRVLAAMGGVVVIFLVALLLGRAASHSASPTANRSTSSIAPSAAARPGAATSAAPAAGAPGTSAPAANSGTLGPVQSFGSGGTGFQVVRVRYGVFNGSQRIVFDIGLASGSAQGAPTATVASAGTATLLVTFKGTLPAGTLAPVPSGGVVTSITRVPSSDGTTTYRFSLSRAASPVAFYLGSPLRFVLDLH